MSTLNNLLELTVEDGIPELQAVQRVDTGQLVLEATVQLLCARLGVDYAALSQQAQEEEGQAAQPQVSPGAAPAEVENQPDPQARYRYGPYDQATDAESPLD